MKFIRQILSDEFGVGSSTRTAYMAGLIVICYVVVSFSIPITFILWKGTLTESAVGLFKDVLDTLAIYATSGYLIHKGTDAFTKRTPNIILPNPKKVEINTEVPDVDNSKAGS